LPDDPAHYLSFPQNELSRPVYDVSRRVKFNWDGAELRRIVCGACWAQPRGATKRSRRVRSAQLAFGRSGVKSVRACSSGCQARRAVRARARTLTPVMVGLRAGCQPAHAVQWAAGCRFPTSRQGRWPPWLRDRCELVAPPPVFWVEYPVAARAKPSMVKA
jgi:hypothetical protein